MAKACAVCSSTEGPDHVCGGAVVPLIGQVLDGRYHIGEVLGHGGMGMVFRANQTSMQRAVAVKTLHPALAAAPEFFERFRREAEIASRLRHPNIITIFDFGRTHDGTCYYVMELVEGQSLKQLVKGQGPMSLGRAADLMEQAARALAHAHQMGVVHRDVKPHNMMVQPMDQRDFLKVLDFGLVKALEQDEEHQLTSTGQVLGTPQYMPPEQAGGELVDQRSDLYSLAAVFYYCLTGTSPFGAKTVRKALQASLTQTVQPVSRKRRGAPVPLALDEFFRTALAREKEDRYQSAEEFIEQLHGALHGLTREDLDALPDPPDPSGPAREGSGSSASQRAPRGTVAGRKARRGGGSSAPKVIVDSGAARPWAASGSAGTGVVRPRRTGSRTGEPRDAQASNSPGGRLGWATALGAAIVLVGGLGTWLYLQPVPPAAITTQAPQTPSPLRAASSQDGAEQPDAVAVAPHIVVRVESEPHGAGIYDGEVQIGTTPAELRFPRSAVQTLGFRLKGHAPAERTLDFSRLAEDQTTVKVALERKSEPRGTNRTPPRTRWDEGSIPVFE
jgi:serine/threonine protein kinase